jgi:hypothetical protein
MDNKDNKRGFSGLSDLTSDTGTLPQFSASSNQSTAISTTKAGVRLAGADKVANSSGSMVERRCWRDLGLGGFLPDFSEEAEDRS